MDLDKGWIRSSVLVQHSLPRTKRRGRFRLPFGAVLSILVALGTAISGLTIGVLFWNAIERGNEPLAGDIESVILEGVIQQLNALSLVPRQTLASLSALMLLEEAQSVRFLSLSNDALRRILFAHSLASFDGVFLAFPDGTMMGYAGPMVAPFTFVNSTTNSTLTSFATNSLGLPVTVLSNMTNFDARKKDWFIKATSQVRLPLGQVNWTNTEIFEACHCLGITASRPVVLGSRLLAVVGARVRLETLSLAMNTSLIGKTGQAFVIDRSGNLVAAADPARINFSFSGVLTSAESIVDPVFQDLIRFLLRQGGGSFATIPVVSPMFVLLAGQPHLIATTKVAQVTGLNWTAVAIIPRSDYFAPSDDAAEVALVVGCVAVFVITLIAVVLSLICLTWPLLRLARAMDATDIVTEVPPTRRRESFIHEVAKIEQSYDNMVHGIYSFGKFVPKPVVRTLVQNAEEPTVNVTARECTFFFSDIVGFTAIAQEHSDVVLNALLTEYFEAMETIIYDLEGLTTDFLGDGLFVFWNAPNLLADHPRLACEAALRQQSRLVAMRQSWVDRGLPELHVRIGINTGPCLVGNFGSRNHLKYTVMGDAVNVASRLEQLNKCYGSKIMIGPSTFELVKDEFLARPLELVILKGRTEATYAFELVCRQEDATPMLRRIVDLSFSMLEAFEKHLFEAAFDYAGEILAETPGDVAAQTIMRNCTELKISGLPRGWTPARQLYEK